MLGCLMVARVPQTWGGDPAAVEAQYDLKLLVPASYLPGIPILARVELLHQDHSRAKEIWDSAVDVSTPTPGIMLSPNRILMRNGLGSALVTATNGGDFVLVVSTGSLQTSRTLLAKTNASVTTVAGTLSGDNTTWSGIVKVTADVLVPVNHTLTIQPDTLVLITGASSNPNGKDLEVRGRLLALGTEAQPITFTASTNGVNWGEIRHADAVPSLYQWCTFTRAGRGVTGGHTSTAPTFRLANSKVTFENCNFTDNTTGSSTNTVGKVMEATDSDLALDNCLWARARMGPEINGAALRLTNSHITEMLGPDDSDGIYIHNQKPGQNITIEDTVIAQGDDDGIDTLGSDITVQNCIIRDWKNLNEDSKGISVFGGAVRVSQCLLVDNKCGISGKDEKSIRIYIDRCTIVANYEYALGALNKTGGMFPSEIDIRVNNSILRTLNLQTNTLFTSYNPADLHISYSNLGQAWAGATNCLVVDPHFRDVANHDYRLEPGSPCIDTGDPDWPRDPDGSRMDMGCFTFIPPPPALGNPGKAPLGGFQFLVGAYANRNYRIEISTNGQTWNSLTTIFQTNESSLFQDPSATNDGLRMYRAKWGP